ncbi:hypothetical protein ACFFHK_01230 [Gallibacterium trehalosifermentans]|uniref:Chalcone isomerase domain-containing protein n=1 Tax=Gallibacterium trehalosifermentans TaxID=516935 RepID=A0ABV6GY86_9PAST
MKFFSFCLGLILSLYVPFSSANWQQVGKAEYNWGPFHIYTVSLFTENGTYNSEQRPLLLRIKFAKPVEGKNFAISMVKEMDIDKINPKEVDQLRKRLIKNFPDFKPNDVLNYIALEQDGYFVLNNTILVEHFDRAFNHQFISIWLDSESSFKKLQPRLLGEDKDSQTNIASKQNMPTNNTESRASANPLLVENKNNTENNADLIDKNNEKKQSDNKKTSHEITTTISPSPMPEVSAENMMTNSDKTEMMNEQALLEKKVSPVINTQHSDTKPEPTVSIKQTEMDSPQPIEKDKENNRNKQEIEKQSELDQPTEPAIEIDPIMPYQKQFYC